MNSWDFVRSDDKVPTSEPVPDCSRPASVVQEVIYQENDMVFETHSLGGIGVLNLTPEEMSGKDIEPAVAREEQDIDVGLGEAHAVTFCLRCPRVVVALLDSVGVADLVIWVSGLQTRNRRHVLRWLQAADGIQSFDEEESDEGCDDVTHGQLGDRRGHGGS